MGKRSHWSRKSRYTCSHDQKWVFLSSSSKSSSPSILSSSTSLLSALSPASLSSSPTLSAYITFKVKYSTELSVHFVIKKDDHNFFVDSHIAWSLFHLEMRSLFFYPLFPLSIDSFLWESPLERSLSKHGHNVIDTLWRHEAHPHNKIYFTFPPFLFLLDLIIVTAVFN